MLLNSAKMFLLLCMIHTNLQGKLCTYFTPFKSSRCLLYFHLQSLLFQTCLPLTFPSGWSCHMVTHVLNCVVYLIF